MTNMIKLSAPFSGGSTIIPNSFFDIYMPRANGYYVKVYLFLQRFFQSGHSNLSVTEVADTFDLTESDVVRSLSYWEREGLLDVSVDEEGNITKIRLISTDNPAAGPDHSPAADPIGEEAIIQEPDPDHCAKETQLLLVIEQYLGHPLGRKDIEKISYFHDDLGFSYELVDYLFSYCADIGKPDMNYIEKVALGWARSGVKSPAQAQMQTQIHETGAWKIMNELGLGSRQPAPAELTYIQTWQKEYGFSEEMILEACRRTVIAVHGPSFAYADSILSSWKELGITNLQELSLRDEARKKEKEKAKGARQDSRPLSLQTRKGKAAASANRFHNFSQRSYNFSDLEQKLLHKSRQAAAKE